MATGRGATAEHSMQEDGLVRQLALALRLFGAFTDAG